MPPPPVIPGYTPIQRLEMLRTSAQNESYGDDGETLKGVETLVYYGQGDEILDWLRWALATLKETT
jgi:hypothetical protein